MFRISFLVAAGWCVAKCFAEQNVTTLADSAKAPVDQLIPWLLDEDRQLRGIAFSEVILDTTGKHVLAVDRKNGTDERVIKQISAALDVRRCGGWMRSPVRFKRSRASTK